MDDAPGRHYRFFNPGKTKAHQTRGDLRGRSGGEFSIEGRRQANDDVIPRVEKRFDFICWMLNPDGSLRALENTYAIIQTSLIHNLSMAILNLDCLYGTMADTFVTISTILYYGINY